MHPLLDAEGDRVTNYEEDAEVLNVFCASVYNSKISSLGQPSKLENRDEEQNEFPTSLKVSELLLRHK